MPVKINYTGYNGVEVDSIKGGQKATINCKGKKMEDNLVIDASGINEKDSDTLDQLIEGTLTEIENDRVTELSPYLFENLETLVSASFPNATSVKSNCFRNATALEYVNIPKATGLAPSCFQNTKLTYFDSQNLHTMYSSVFHNCSNFTRLFLRRNGLCNIGSTSMFTGTPFASGGTGGTAYVPRNLIASYQTATNWSALYGGGTCTFLAIEDYTVDGTTTGELDWDKMN